MPKPTPKQLEQFYAEDRIQWRKWLEKNHAKSPGVRLVFFKKESGENGISYEEAVEEAIAFGWIDSRTNKLDSQRYMVQFSPRKPGSIWAKSNKRRVEKLVKEGRMTPICPKLSKYPRKTAPGTSWTILMN
jgi:uncharacterized protein YdeI (YjbR/CyaY-like superfamily)